uniref:Uncharacterized protein n=1 Tax=Anopheles maculatus TaxID=74869 RepID=A0A182SLQ3_9DIPT
MTISSPLSFYQIAAHDVYSNDSIGGIDFDRWYEHTLWTDGREHQVYRGMLRSRKMVFRDSILGNGTINGASIGDIVRKLHTEKQLVEGELTKRRSSYRTSCRETQALINGTQEGLYFFNYFVQRQTIREQRSIQSFWTFQHQGNYFLTINFGCGSKFYQWNPQDRTFVGLFKVHTGYVFEWATVAGLDDEESLYLITRSAPTEEQCNVTGLTIWQFKGLSLEMSKNSPNKDIDSVYVDPATFGRFYVLDRTTVLEYDLSGNVQDEWDLSRIFDTASFLPDTLGVGLALSDGKQIAVLSRKETVSTTRKKRSHDDPLVNLALFASPMNVYNHMQRNNSYYRIDDTPDEYSPDVALLTQPDPLNEIGSMQESNDTVIQTREASTDLVEPPTEHLPEPRIAKAVPLGRISTTENHHFPDPATGELLSLHVGFQGQARRLLIAVTNTVNTIVKGNHDTIRIYSDILQGHLFQIISCNRPSQLTVLEIRDETILAFMENHRKVQLYTYRGARKGFVHWNSFNLASAGIQMASVKLPQAPFFKCNLHYLAIALSSRELMFLKAKTQGDCGINLQLDCGDV